MGSFISNFNTTAELATFSATTDFSKPHVSLTKDDRKVHFFKDPCASEKVKTTYEWVEIGGVKWATKNVGAESITDYGQYFSWGGINGFTADQVSGDCHSKAFSWSDYELATGSPYGITKYNSIDGKTVLESVDDAATANMSSGWRMPTRDEYVALGYAVNTAFTSDYQGSGVAGLVCTDRNDSNKVLFFPAGGRCLNGSLNNASSNGYYWSSSLHTSNVQNAYSMNFKSGNVQWSEYLARFSGFFVRGVIVG